LIVGIGRGQRTLLCPSVPVAPMPETFLILDAAES